MNPRQAHTVDSRAAVDGAQQRAVERFLFREAELMDQHRYEEWEALWADEGVYWVPAFHEDYDPDERVSLIYDTRAGIAARVRRLAGKHAYAQQPRTRLVRTISNVVVSPAGDDEILCHSTFQLIAQRHGAVDVWGGRVTHRLRATSDREFLIAYKKVALVPLGIPLGNLSFLV